MFITSRKLAGLTAEHDAINKLIIVIIIILIFAINPCRDVTEIRSVIDTLNKRAAEAISLDNSVNTNERHYNIAIAGQYVTGQQGSRCELYNVVDELLLRKLALP